MSFWDEIKEKAAWAADQLNETFEEVKDRTSTEYEVYKVQRQIGSAEEEIDGLYQKLGRRAFELVQEGRLDDAESKGLSEELQSKKDAIAKLETEIEKLREQLEEERQKRKEAAEAGEAEEVTEEDGDDGEAIWEDEARDDGTPPPP